MANVIMYKDFRKSASYRIKDNLKAYEITGELSDETLNHYFTKDNEYSDIDTASYQFSLNEEGEVLAEAIIYKREDRYIIFSEQDINEILKDVSHEDFECRENRDLAFIQIEGADSPQVVAPFYAPYEISTLEFRNIVTFRFKENELLLARYGFSGEFGYQIVLPKSLLEEFIQEKLAHLPQYSAETEKQINTEVGQPFSHFLFTQRYNLCELGYLWNIDFSKPDFRGREAILNLVDRSNRLMIMAKAYGEVNVHESVLFDREYAGEIVVSFPVDENKKEKMVLVMLEDHYAVSGISLLTSQNVVVETLSSPFVIPESWSL